MGLGRRPRYTTIEEGGVTGWLSSLCSPASPSPRSSWPAYVRMTRAYVLESLSEDYVRTARAKGLPSGR